ncbi:MAG: B12-binding domain-containing radical SAM protein, partial [Candidatus Bathyarchaeales archaeon]
MHVCLINPPRIQPKAWGKPSVFQPIGLAYIAAVLEKAHKVCIIDTPTEGWRNLQQIDETKYRVGLSRTEIADRLKRWAPDVVVIEIPFSGWSRTAFEVAAIAKSINPSVVTVLEGQHPSARTEDCLANPNVDFVVIGEPEITIAELIDALDKKTGNQEKIRGIGFKKNGAAVITPQRPLLENLDALPFPARHLLPIKDYYDAVKENPLRGEIYKPWTALVTSRGC